MLSQYAHFSSILHPYIIYNVTQVFAQQVIKLHELPKNMVTNKDPIFISKFWHELFNIHGVQAHMSIVYHPLTNRQSNITNKTLETQLQRFIKDNPRNWFKQLSLVEWWYNPNFQLGMTIVTHGLDFIISISKTKQIVLHKLDPNLIEFQVSIRHLFDRSWYKPDLI